jgi:hypothetical protein
MHTNRPVLSRAFVAINNHDLDDAVDSAEIALRTAVYNSTTILKSFRVDKKAYRFPKSIGVSDPANAPDAPRSKTGSRQDFLARDSVIRNQLQVKIGSQCGRFLNHIVRVARMASTPVKFLAPRSISRMLGHMS